MPTLSCKSSLNREDEAISFTISPRIPSVAQQMIFSMTLELYFWQDKSATCPSTHLVMRSDSVSLPCSIKYYMSLPSHELTWMT